MSLAKELMETPKVPVNWAADSSELYIEGYFLGARLLRLDTSRPNVSKVALIYPTAFLYRHYFELRLKRLLTLSCKLLDQIPTFNLTKNHCLRKIWEELKPLIPKIDIDFGPEETALVEKAVGDIDTLDESSTAFRYARNKKDAPNLESLKDFDLEHLGETMHDIHWALESLAFTLHTKLNDKRQSGLN